ncbi:extracellular triacylglycerol lipase, putative [Cordyceps militaris CM01]|uniref:Extracellular triacylglycerol lipase, putative n=1 Tax=Cordyceps militaris (strain CM01) TaxID=983644 RepID=G3JLG5_CORMM|nr:extracellular triacylglycerol lipase, putative [Cordyceps militaris CM01]EGX90539.1 extracellular triacylglycerol lipase, putative [Cordyceps militaris CM01]
MWLILLACLLHAAGATPQAPGVSADLFASLERLARLVDISYCIGSTGISEPFNCLSRCAEFPNVTLSTTWSTGLFMTDSCGYVAVDETPADPSLAIDSHGAIIVAFRGTYSIADTVVDLSTVPQKYVPYPSPGDGPAHKCTNCTVHMGFYKAWQTAKESVISEIVQLRRIHPSKPIHLIGHSLGGAVACLAALELKTNIGLDNLVVTTFGEPRVGNDGLVDFINRVFDLNDETDLERRSYRRLTHTNDPVPLLPPGEWGYMSHAGEIHITKSQLSPAGEDLQLCKGNHDKKCSAGQDSTSESLARLTEFYQSFARSQLEKRTFPTRLKLWQLFFAHRDYFWRLGLCFPGGDPFDWGRGKTSELDAVELEAENQEL